MTRFRDLMSFNSNLLNLFGTERLCWWW
uniref:Uncharacterized protein n=1 Tax=Arundo donax TaxID=35708 RepID=A0A0A9BWT1_ARUDO